MVLQTEGRTDAPRGGDEHGSVAETEQRHGISRRAVVGGAAGLTVVGLTTAALAWLNRRGGGGGGIAQAEGGGGVLTGPNRVGDAIERDPRAQEALRKFFGSDTLVFSDLTPEQAANAPVGSAFGNINAPNSGGLGVNVTVNHPTEGQTPYEVGVALEDGSFTPENWVSDTLRSGRQVYYQRSIFPLFSIVGGDTGPNPANKFLVAGQYPPGVLQLDLDGRVAALRNMTEALDAAGALR